MYRAKKVYETLGFQRGQSSKQSLNIGSYRKIENPTKEDILNLEEGFYMLESAYEPFFTVCKIGYVRSIGKNYFNIEITNNWYETEEEALKRTSDALLKNDETAETLDDWIDAFSVISIKRIKNQDIEWLG